METMLIFCTEIVSKTQTSVDGQSQYIQHCSVHFTHTGTVRHCQGEAMPLEKNLLLHQSKICATHRRPLALFVVQYSCDYVVMLTVIWLADLQAQCTCVPNALSKAHSRCFLSSRLVIVLVHMTVCVASGSVHDRTWSQLSL